MPQITLQRQLTDAQDSDELVLVDSRGNQLRLGDNGSVRFSDALRQLNALHIDHYEGTLPDRTIRVRTDGGDELQVHALRMRGVRMNWPDSTGNQLAGGGVLSEQAMTELLGQVDGFLDAVEKNDLETISALLPLVQAPAPPSPPAAVALSQAAAQQGVSAASLALGDE